ncbi:DNA topoisomerase IB [Tautonia plasticadhaerens]|uniref:DNA topoisomerase n=1 Tax=Tautonia plasticadhaerens TaxID=2527974 RepID=A0A518GXT5_9BACT|nr:DNA topoisomerase IB [Tautonia plasticadhaerens]QDV33408.1 Eukaryotic DNA topoisomerase I, catalytic core [Tautonia plasticadhaerens]
MPAAVVQSRSPVRAESAESAESAGLRHASDDGPGIRRVRCGLGFRYEDPAGRTIRDREVMRRIASLAIPPAWTGVWICPDPSGHLQATGRDARGRKQYRYHPRWRSVRDETKYARMIAFGASLGRLRTRIDRDLRRRGLPREKVLAVVVRLLEVSLIRVGNDDYAERNHSYGLTTLRDRHVSFEGGTIRFAFRGKSGVSHEVDLHDARLARVIRRCRDLPGQELFQYLDQGGKVVDVGSADVNDYLREATGRDFTAKDFRTWAGTVLAAMALQECESCSSESEAKRNIVRAVGRVAERLGNTPTVCRKCYVHPAVIDAYLDGTMLDALRRRADRALSDDLKHLRPEEAAVLALLRSRLSREQSGRKTRRRTA